MCQAFSCLVLRNGEVIWEAGKDSHDELVTKYKVRDDTLDMRKIAMARIEIVPDNTEKYPYLWPEKPWKLIIDERVKPTWLKEKHEKAAWVAFEQWKEAIYSGINLTEARNPINPLVGDPRKPTAKDIALLSQYASIGASVWDSVWASVWDSVRASVRASTWDSVGASVWNSVWASVRASTWDSVGASVWDSVGASVWNSVRDSGRASAWDSVWAYQGSLFTKIREWKYYKTQKGYPFQSCVDLWKRGFVPSFDGKVWRLHSGKDAKVVYEWKPERK